MAKLFVVTDGNSFLEWDDKGAMATGYPRWVELADARTYKSFSLAERAAESAWNGDKTKTLWVQELLLTTATRTPFVPVEQDPEYPEYLRLKKKFKNR